jgi:peptide/nickel transport system permease protein
MTARGWAFFLGRRVALMALLLVVISFLVFTLLYVSPGSAITALLGTNPRTPAEIAFLTHKYHLDQPFLTQYWIWATGAVHLQFGDSIETTQPVTQEISERLPTSLFLGLYAYLLTMVLGVGLGIASALRKRTAVDRTIVATSVVGLSSPAFVLGVVLIYLFAIVLPLFPVAGGGTGFLNEVWHLTLPAVALTLVGTAYLIKHTRASMIAVLDQDYVTFARARGLSPARVILLYELRNALVPVVTISGVILAFLVTGAVLIEETFSLPGIGQLLVESAMDKDLPMVLGLSIVIAFIIMAANLLADVALVAVDPRIRLGRSAR